MLVLGTCGRCASSCTKHKRSKPPAWLILLGVFTNIWHAWSSDPADMHAAAAAALWLVKLLTLTKDSKSVQLGNSCRSLRRHTWEYVKLIEHHWACQHHAHQLQGQGSYSGCVCHVLYRAMSTGNSLYIVLNPCLTCIDLMLLLINDR